MPSPEEVRALRNSMGLSQTKMAQLVGVSWNKKGSNTIRKWETPVGEENHRSISYGVWRLMLAIAGIVDPQDDVVKVRELH
ncbi:hypothetical protein BFV94_4406 [Alteromonas macleodii]|uniref:HTH cro/C1-type domain-containing protein n=2 Tax=Alteromonas macleodii TaxID=28108 RepID=A0AB36FRQ2_ALTMA|nr:hypothetical protein BFV95_4763 [Alteromonas macleodii]OES25553.1 hypothetical protein BFV94_4406 [Alteromonas macleodii]OES25854.1 hypothetical protein BFV93_4317 [Alteromonas macleodii]OES38624.1 hypothetical protein BFV96_4735 [Alteromonas macleodii]